jgi:hypothetical protein
MSNGEMLHLDLEAFERWAIVVDDELREAANAVIALDYPDAEPLRARDLSTSARSNADLVDDLIKKIDSTKDHPERPAWFTPGFQMVLCVSTWAEFLMNYVEEITEHGAKPNDKQVSLIVEKIEPAIYHFDRFLTAAIAAGYF